MLFFVVFGLLSPFLVITSVDSQINYPLVQEGALSGKEIHDVSGPIGDTIGGLVNPFIALAAVIVTGLAFYMQYQANYQAREQFYEGLAEQRKQFEKSLQHQREQFDLESYMETARYQEMRDTQDRIEKIQSFERQFYELLRLHKENVNELSIGLDKMSASSGKTVKSRRVFLLFSLELRFTYELISKIYKYYYPKYRISFDVKIFKISYFVFFEGISVFNKIDSHDLAVQFLLKEKFIVFLKKSLLEFYSNYNPKLEIQILKDSSLDPPKLVAEQQFIFLPFVGQSSRLGHYFRHLFFILKFVSEKDEHLISYSLKRYYLRVLRNQLNNDEQIMLFYNWFSGYGKSWEQIDTNMRMARKGNYFFTDYRIIHNIDENKLIKGIQLKKIFARKEYKDFRYEANRKKEDILFEIHGYQSSLSEDRNQRRNK